MAEDNMMKPMIAVMVIAIIGSLVITLVAKAAPAGPTYCCPIHERLGDPICFFTYDDLATHFTVEHPSEPIDIDWE